MKKISIIILLAFSITSHADLLSDVPPVRSELKSFKINDGNIECALSDRLDLIILTPNFGQLSVDATINNTYIPIVSNKSTYSQKTKIFIHKLKIEQKPDNINVNGISVGLCK